MSVKSLFSGQAIPTSAALSKTFLTVFRDAPQIRAMLRSLNLRLFSLRISRYLVILEDLLVISHDLSCHYKYIGQVDWLSISGTVALDFRTGGSKWSGIFILHKDFSNTILVLGYARLFHVSLL